MTDQDRFNIVFSGELARGVELAQAQANLAKLFKLNTDKVQALFSGKRVVLKRNLNLDQASQYRVAIKKAGALVELVACAAEPQNSATLGDAQPVTHTQSREAPGAMSSAAGGMPGESSQGENDKTLTLSEPGADVLAPHERQSWQEKKVDTSYLSVKEGGGDLLEPDEKRLYEEKEFDLRDYQLAEPGADVLRPQERSHVVPRKVDTSALSLAEPGPLPSTGRVTAVTPDTSHFSLAEEPSD